jgi:hypothetical protein
MTLFCLFLALNDFALDKILSVVKIDSSGGTNNSLDTNLDDSIIKPMSNRLSPEKAKAEGKARREIVENLMNLFPTINVHNPDYTLIKIAIQGYGDEFKMMFSARLRLLGFPVELIRWIEEFIYVK